MDIKYMSTLGIIHHEKGMMLTPFDCRHIDEEIFTHTRKLKGVEQFRLYSRLRGAFNIGWQTANAAA